MSIQSTSAGVTRDAADYGRYGLTCILSGVGLAGIIVAVGEDSGFAAVIALMVCSVFTLTGVILGVIGYRSKCGKVVLGIACVVAALLMWSVVSYYYGGTITREDLESLRGVRGDTRREYKEKGSCPDSGE